MIIEDDQKKGGSATSVYLPYNTHPSQPTNRLMHLDVLLLHRGVPPHLPLEAAAQARERPALPVPVFLLLLLLWWHKKAGSVKQTTTSPSPSSSFAFSHTSITQTSSTARTHLVGIGVWGAQPGGVPGLEGPVLREAVVRPDEVPAAWEDRWTERMVGWGGMRGGLYVRGSGVGCVFRRSVALGRRELVYVMIANLYQY